MTVPPLIGRSCAAKKHGCGSIACHNQPPAQQAWIRSAWMCASVQEPMSTHRPHAHLTLDIRHDRASTDWTLLRRQEARLRLHCLPQPTTGSAGLDTQCMDVRKCAGAYEQNAREQEGGGFARRARETRSRCGSTCMSRTGLGRTRLPIWLEIRDKCSVTISAAWLPWSSASRNSLSTSGSRPSPFSYIAPSERGCAS